LILLLIGAFFTLIFSPITGGISLGIGGIIFLVALLLFPILLLLSWGMLFVSAGISHLFVLIFGVRQGSLETFKAKAYAMAPTIFSIIPFINWAAGIYTMVLEVIGIKHRQKLSWGKSVAVILIPIGVVFVLTMIFYLFFVFSVIGTSLAAGGFS